MHVSILSVCSFFGRLLSGTCLPTHHSLSSLTQSRRRVRLPSEGAARLSPMVPDHRIPNLSLRPSCSPQYPKPALPWFCLRAHWSRVRIPVWMLPVPCRRSIRCTWFEHKLGLHDAFSCDQWEYLQPLLRDSV